MWGMGSCGGSLIFGRAAGEGALCGENSMHATRFSRVGVTHAPHTRITTVCACSGKRVVVVRKTRKSKPGIGSVCQMRERKSERGRGRQGKGSLKRVFVVASRFVLFI